MSLNAIFPESIAITLAGKQFTVREFQARELPTVLALAAKLTDVSQDSMTELLATEPDKLFALLARMTGQGVADVESLSVSDFATLIEEVVKANADFFVRALPSTIQRVTEQIRATTGLSASSS